MRRWPPVMTNSARRSPPDYPVPGLSGTARWRSRQWCGPAMLVPIVPAHIDPLPPIGRQAPAPAAIVIIVGIVGRAEDGETAEVMMAEEEGVAADEGPAGAGEARTDRRVREAGPAESRSAKTGAGKMRAAHAADMHAAEAAGVHSATEATAVHPAAEAATMAAARTSTTSGEHGRSDRQCRSDGRRDDAGEKPVGHLNILLVTATVSPLQRIR